MGKRVFKIMIICALCLMVLGGCNTIKGVGRDIQDSAEGVQKLFTDGN